MSFHEVPWKGPGTLGGTMTAALYRSRKGVSFRLLLGRDLLHRLGWDEAVRARLLFGVGQDLGRARLQRTASGGSRLARPVRNRPHSGCLVFSTQRLPANAARRAHSAESVEFDAADDAVEFRLPAWLFADEAA
jgi:hypothetical protein